MSIGINCHFSKGSAPNIYSCQICYTIGVSPVQKRASLTIICSVNFYDPMDNSVSESDLIVDPGLSTVNAVRLSYPKPRMNMNEDI